MNHLAHFYLSDKNEDLILGNWVADFIRQPQVAQFSEGIQRGIFLHRKIDSFSDEHELMRAAAARLRLFAGKYSKVLVDIFNDYSLSKNWSLFSPDESLADFSKQIYEVLKKREADLPPDLRERTARMISADWLTGYGSAEGLRFVVERFKKRMAMNEYFQKAAPDLDSALDYFLLKNEEFDTNFKPFFMELENEVWRFLEHKT